MIFNVLILNNHTVVIAIVKQIKNLLKYNSFPFFNINNKCTFDANFYPLNR